MKYLNVHSNSFSQVEKKNNKSKWQTEGAGQDAEIDSK